MVFDFYPWNLDVDVEGTRLLYRDNDYAGKRKVNERFWQAMSDRSVFFIPSAWILCGWRLMRSSTISLMTEMYRAAGYP